MKKNKNTSKLIIACVVALLTTMIAYSAFSHMNRQLMDQQRVISQMQSGGGKFVGDNQETYTYAVATKNLKAGEIVADTDVDFKQFPEKQPNAFEDSSEVVNKVLLRDIQAGTTFTTTYIAKVSSDDVTLRPGYRALTLPAENFQGKSNKMLAGSTVDIYSASSDSPWNLEDVRIVALENDAGTASTTTGAAGTSAADITKASAVTFEVSSDEIADFITNASKGKLVLVARNPNDRNTHKHYHPASSSLAYAPIKRSSSGSRVRRQSYSYGGSSRLPNLPSSVPIKNLGGLSGLPQPIKPNIIPQQSSSVELIQANVKSKVTFN